MPTSGSRMHPQFCCLRDGDMGTLISLMDGDMGTIIILMDGDMGTISLMDGDIGTIISLMDGDMGTIISQMDGEWSPSPPGIGQETQLSLHPSSNPILYHSRSPFISPS